MSDFEKLGAFYLGKLFDLDRGTVRPELLLYNSRDLTTHAVCVGMTGSGKTGLCLSLLEEAAIDGIPALAIDPKGDLGNLALTFPNLQAGDFLPWIDEGEAARRGITLAEGAANVAALWQRGLAEWGQDGARVARFRDAVDLTIYTPGSSAGVPLTILRSFAPPAAAVAQDADAFRERVGSAVAGLLALLNINTDPINSREYILLSHLFDRAWRAGEAFDMATLIRQIQSPPFDKVGILDLETFFPTAARFSLAMQLNNLLGSPSFAGWLQGEPLDVQRLLYTTDGKPRLSIISIAHLNDTERMFFVTILLNEVVAWMRSQPGTSSLRALLYMDEVFGYFPPSANPPSKLPMLTLLKQARAFGLGIVLATQNPVDLDYKGLSNAGTWFLGRLQTERDKARVLDGLEGASAASGAAFDRKRLEATLSGLRNRVFLMNNVHEDAPVVFQTRWALSYLRGPLSRQQIEQLMASKKVQPAAAVPEKCPLRGAPEGGRPVLPPGIDELFVRPTRSPAEQEHLIYRPAIWGVARLHFVKASLEIDHWKNVQLLAPVGPSVPEALWEGAQSVDRAALDFEKQPRESVPFATLPAPLTQPRQYGTWRNALKDYLYRDHVVTLYVCPALKLQSAWGETKGEFRVRVKQAALERRDLELEKLQKSYAPKLQSLQERIRKCEQRLAQEKAQAQHQVWDTVVSVGATVLGAMFGRKLSSVGNVSRASTSMRSASRASREREDVTRAEDNLRALQDQLIDLEESFTRESDTLRDKLSGESLEIQDSPLRPRKTDLAVEQLALVWTPWLVDQDGLAEPAFEGRPAEASGAAGASDE